MQKNPKVSLKAGYRKRFETAMILALALMIVAFYQSRSAIYGSGEKVTEVDVKIEVAEIPQTEQIHRPPPPARPVVPVPTEAEDVPDDLTIETTELDLTELPPPPPPEVEQDVDAAFVFIPYDEAPEMVGGTAALAKILKYPELARKAGVEGTVMVGALIDVDGKVKKTTIIKDSGVDVGFEAAAMEAVMKTKWKPAKQRDRVVKVWIAIPVKFRLRKSQAPG